MTRILHTGTVRLTAGNTVLIPAATSDPNDPLNLPHWRKSLIVISLSIFSATTLSLIAGLGGILNFYAAKEGGSEYDAARLGTLMTYPVITMGIGCLIGLPLSLALGRRVVIIGASIVAVLSITLCATAKSYKWHFWARMILGLAAGQSEVLVPVIVQECFFLHQRSRCLLVQQAIQSTIATVLILLAGPIANALSPEGWYSIGGGLAGAQLCLAVLFHPDTLYDRPLSAFAGVKQTIQELSTVDSVNLPLTSEMLCLEKPLIITSETDTHTCLAKLQMFRNPIRWRKAGLMFKNMFRSLRSPIVWWAILTNAFALGATIALSMVYGTILSGEPYHWLDSNISYTNVGQIVVALIAIPVLGYGSDSYIQWKATRNQGIHEPEARLIPAVLVVAVGILQNALVAAASIDKRAYSSFLFVWCVAANNFYFVGVNIMCFTYCLDTFARGADSILVLVCASRNFLSFCLIYGFQKFMASGSYTEAFSTFAGLAALTGLLNGIVYIWGKRFRKSTPLLFDEVVSAS